MSPGEMTDEEEAAFPPLSRAAHAATMYTEAARRAAVRTSSAICVVPVGAEFSGRASPMICRLLPEEDPDVTSVARINALAASMLSSPPGSRPPLPVCPAYALDMVSALQVRLLPSPAARDRCSCSAPLPRLPSWLWQAHVPGWPTSAATITADVRKRVARTDVVLSRVLEGLPEQEPWLGGGVGRVQFYLDVRNHVLLKWALSQSQSQQGRQRRTQHEGDDSSSGEVRSTAGLLACL